MQLQILILVRGKINHYYYSSYQRRFIIIGKMEIRSERTDTKDPLSRQTYTLGIQPDKQSRLRDRLSKQSDEQARPPGRMSSSDGW